MHCKLSRECETPTPAVGEGVAMYHVQLVWDSELPDPLGLGKTTAKET